MLADDAEIRELSEPWLKQLEALLTGGRRNANLRARDGRAPVCTEGKDPWE